MPHELSVILQQTVDRELPALRELPEDRAALKPADASEWSPKEELGHLIDSATNNHVRFVRAALEPELYGLGYAQDQWVGIHAYQRMSWTAIVDFWSQYNYFLAGLIANIPREKLSTNCYIGSGSSVTLRFLVEDYVRHMQHHIDHLLARPAVTPYP